MKNFLSDKMQQYLPEFPNLGYIMNNEIAGAHRNPRRVARNIIGGLHDKLHWQGFRPVNVSQMKEIIWDSLSVPLIVSYTLRIDPSLLDRFISDDLTIRTMQAVASDFPKEYHFDPEYNDITFAEEEAEMEKIE